MTNETDPNETLPLSRREFIKAGGTVAAAAALGVSPAFAQPATPIPVVSDFSLDQLADDAVLDELEKGLPFAGLNSFMKLPYSRQIDGADLVIMGVPFDSGTTNRSGARFGPRAIREQSYYASAFRPVYPWAEDITQQYRMIDFGDVVPFPGNFALDMMLAQTEAVAARILRTGAGLLSLGGDHTLPYGPVRAAAAQYGALALIHIDAHQDSYSSDDGTGFRLISHGTFATDLAVEGHIDVSKSIQVYIRTTQPPTPGGYEITYANDALAMGSERLAERIRARAGDAPVYITLDIDALDPAFAPGNGSPVSGGASTAEVRRLLQGLDGLNVVAADVVEVNPMFDPTGATSIAAATLAIDLLHLMGHAKDRR